MMYAYAETENGSENSAARLSRSNHTAAIRHTKHSQSGVLGEHTSRLALVNTCVSGAGPSERSASR